MQPQNASRPQELARIREHPEDDGAAVLRQVCRSVIRRVVLENGGHEAAALHKLLKDANPFATTADTTVRAIWYTEVLANCLDYPLAESRREDSNPRTY